MFVNYNINTAQAQAALAAIDAKMMATSGIIQSSSRLADTALMAVSASFVALGAGAFVAYNAVNQFQESLTTVRALGGVTEKDMYALADSINQVAAQFGVSGDEIAAGAVMLSKAGLTVDEINESIGAMTALSKANGIAFEEAARMTVFAVNTFGKEFGESTEIMDAMQVATQQSILDIGDLQKAFAFAGSTAVMSGVSLEQLISIMAVLSNRALQAGISARSVNKMFLDMILNTDELQEWMTSMGMTFEIIRDGKLDIDALMEAFSGQHLTLEMLQSASDIFTVRALRSFGLLIGAADEYGVMLADVTNSQGALMDVVNVQMQSFTAIFAKLRQEFLAPLRSPEVIQQVGIMVDSMVMLFKELQPGIINAVILGLTSFTEIIADPAFLKAMEMLGTGILRIFQVMDYVMALAGGPGGILLKIAVGMKLATLFTNGFTQSQIALASALGTTAIKFHSVSAMAGLHGPLERGFNRNELQTKKLTLQYQMMGQAISMVTTSMMAMMTAGMLLGSADSPMMKNIFMLNAAIIALNTSLMISSALTSAFGSKAALGPGGMIAVAGASFLAINAMAGQFRTHRQESMAEMQIADTGLMSNRHQLVFVEPGEQIISKTQGMAGMGGSGITVNVGDVYTRDGSDFAQRLADELPRALRLSTYKGGF